MTETIAKDIVAAVHYTGTLEDGEVFDSSREREPLHFLVGHGNMIAGFEEEMMGAAVGETREFTLEPARAYGEHDPEGVQTLPRSAFPDEMPVEVGLMLAAETDSGPLPFTIRAVEDDEVTIDFNHDLAGKSLTFEVEVMDLRASTDEERAHGHVHGEHGHHH